jgi:hypothetical protein
VRNSELLAGVFAAVMQQVTAGKGAERHGKGEDFLAQPWKKIADDFGEGFLLGQAAKKMREATHASGWEHERWEREMLGALAYIGFAVVNRRLAVQDTPARTNNATIAVDFEPGLPGTAGREHW